MMSNQCKNCDRDRDLNNNFVGFTNYMAASSNNNNNNSGSNRNTASSVNMNGSSNSSNNTSSNGGGGNSAVMMQGPKITAKVMFGSLGAIKELREKEHAEKARSTHAGRRH